MSRRAIDALFVAYFADMDRWHNEGDKTQLVEEPSPDDMSRKARMFRDGVALDGRLHDFPRFLSRVRYGTAAEYRRYDSYSLTLLSGTYYLSYLRRHGFDVEVANATDRVAIGELAHEVEPRFVMISTTLILEHEIVKSAVESVRFAWPNAIIVLGGLFLVELEKTTPKRSFKRLLQHYGADAFVVTPLGETATSSIMQYESRDALSKARDIPSTYLRVGNEIVAPPSCDDEAIPIDDGRIHWNGIPGEHLYHTVHARTARSCAFKCAFCNFPVNQGALTVMSMEAVKAELDDLSRVPGVRSVVFTDDTFNVPQKRFKEICRLLKEYRFDWYSFFRAQFADEETVRLMKESGCKAVFLGIESADEQILENMNKVAKIDDMKRGIEMLNRHGIHCHASFIVGFPGETQESARKIVDFVDEMEIDFCSIAPFYYVPSTPISQRAEEFGLTGSFQNWSHATMTAPEAFVLAEQLSREPRYTIHAPDLAANEFWSQIILYSNGFTLADVRTAFATFNHFRGRAVTSEELEAAPETARLREVLKSHEMPRPINYRTHAATGE